MGGCVVCKHSFKNSSCRFFRFPRNKVLKSKWCLLARVSEWELKDYNRICSCHFQDDDVDPSLFPWNKEPKQERPSQSEESAQRRKLEPGHRNTPRGGWQRRHAHNTAGGGVRLRPDRPRSPTHGGDAAGAARFVLTPGENGQLTVVSASDPAVVCFKPADFAAGDADNLASCRRNSPRADDVGCGGEGVGCDAGAGYAPLEESPVEAQLPTAPPLDGHKSSDGASESEDVGKVARFIKQGRDRPGKITKEERKENKNHQTHQESEITGKIKNEETKKLEEDEELDHLSALKSLESISGSERPNSRQASPTPGPDRRRRSAKASRSEAHPQAADHADELSTLVGRRRCSMLMSLMQLKRQNQERAAALAVRTRLLEAASAEYQAAARRLRRYRGRPAEPGVSSPAAELLRDCGGCGARTVRPAPVRRNSRGQPLTLLRPEPGTPQLEDEPDPDMVSLPTSLPAAQLQLQQLRRRLLQLRGCLLQRACAESSLQLQLEEERLRALQTEAELRGRLEQVFSRPQLSRLLGADPPARWLEKDLLTAIELRELAPRAAFEYVRENLGVPLPSMATVREMAASGRLPKVTRRFNALRVKKGLPAHLNGHASARDEPGECSVVVQQPAMPADGAPDTCRPGGAAAAADDWDEPAAGDVGTESDQPSHEDDAGGGDSDEGWDETLPGPRREENSEPVSPDSEWWSEQVTGFADEEEATPPPPRTRKRSFREASSELSDGTREESGGVPARRDRTQPPAVMWRVSR